MLSSTFSRLAADVIAINSLVGNNDNPGIDAYRHQLEIIGSEFEELEDGFHTDNRKEIRDGLADTLFTVSALYGRMRWALPESLPEPCHGEEPSTLITWIGRQMHALRVLSTIPSDAVFFVAARIADQMLTNCVVLGRALKIDVAADWEAVNDSQWTKFDRDLETAGLTAEKYEEKGIEVYQTSIVMPDDKEYVVTFSARAQLDEKGRQIPAHKWLKSVNFVDVDFSEPELKDGNRDA